MDILGLLKQLFNYIGSAMPLAILCFIIVFLLFSRKVKAVTVISYLLVGTIMFLILLRT